MDPDFPGWPSTDKASSHVWALAARFTSPATAPSAVRGDGGTLAVRPGAAASPVRGASVPSVAGFRFRGNQPPSDPYRRLLPSMRVPFSSFGAENGTGPVN